MLFTWFFVNANFGILFKKSSFHHSSSCIRNLFSFLEKGSILVCLKNVCFITAALQTVILGKSASHHAYGAPTVWFLRTPTTITIFLSLWLLCHSSMMHTSLVNHIIFLRYVNLNQLWNVKNIVYVLEGICFCSISILRPNENIKPLGLDWRRYYSFDGKKLCILVCFNHRVVIVSLKLFSCSGRIRCKFLHFIQ